MKEWKNIFKFAGAVIVILWLVRLTDTILPFDLNKLGILPRSIAGLVGIIFAPFLHGNIFHLLSNTVPLFILLILIFLFYDKVALKAILIIIFIGGFLVWIFGRQAYHIGASGLIYGLVAFLIAEGFFRKNMKSIILAVIIFFLYGSLIYGLFPIHSWMSWEGHLFGAISGVLSAYLYKRPEVQ
jgi:membrane associated rhomboid family serine protease